MFLDNWRWLLHRDEFLHAYFKLTLSANLNILLTVKYLRFHRLLLLERVNWTALWALKVWLGKNHHVLVVYVDQVLFHMPRVRLLLRRYFVDGFQWYKIVVSRGILLGEELLGRSRCWRFLLRWLLTFRLRLLLRYDAREIFVHFLWLFYLHKQIKFTHGVLGNVVSSYY